MEKLEARWPLLKGLTISLFFLYFYIKGKIFGGSDLYSRLDLIFGVYYHVLILYPLILGLSSVLNKRKKIALKIRLFSGILFFFLCSFLIVMINLKTSIFTEVNLEQELVRRSWTELRLGGLSTAIMHYLYFNVDNVYLYRIVVGGIVITSLILFTKSITNSIRWIVKLRAEQLEREALKKREEELKTKIRIKEEIDEKMTLKKEKKLKSYEKKIQQKVEKFMKNTSKKFNGIDKIETIDPQEEEGEKIDLEELLEHAKTQVKESVEGKVENKEEVNDEKTDKVEVKIQVTEDTPVYQKSDDIDQEKLKSLKDEESGDSSEKEKAQ